MGKMNVLIVGGGTGGHISPGIALYQTFKANDIRTFLLVGVKDRKFKYLNEVDDESLIFYGAPSFSKNIFKWPIFLIKFFLSIIKIKKFIKKNSINKVIGMGGYVSAPALIAAKISGVDIYLCEQNSVPGKVTNRFIKYAKKVFATFENSSDFVKEEYKDKVLCVGNPIRKKVLEKIDNSDAKKYFNLQHCDKVLLVIGGSQGAVSINEFVVSLKNNFPKEFKKIGIIWCTGNFSYDKYKKVVLERDNMGSIYISPFVEEVGKAYSASDFAISRSGAGVMMELAAMGIPSLLIPYPYAAQDHQSKNADVFVKHGAAIKIDNSDIMSKESTDVLFGILNNVEKLKRMKRKAFEISSPNAAVDILKEIEK